MRPGDFIIFITPYFTLVAWLMGLLGFLGPQPYHHLSLLNLVPNPTNKTDFPTITIGLFGSCVRNNSDGSRLSCTDRFFGNYGLDVLPDLTTRDILIPPHPVFSFIIIISNIFTFLFLCIWCIFVDYLPVDIRLIEFAIEYIPLVAFVTGLLPSWVVYMFFCQIRDDLNDYNEQLRRVEFVASTGDGFTLVWASYQIVFVAMIILWLHAFKQDPYRTRYGSPLPQSRKYAFDRLCVNAEREFENPIVLSDQLLWNLTFAQYEAHRPALIACGVNTARRTLLQRRNENLHPHWIPRLRQFMTAEMDAANATPLPGHVDKMVERYITNVATCGVATALHIAEHFRIPEVERGGWEDDAKVIMAEEMNRVSRYAGLKKILVVRPR